MFWHNITRHLYVDDVLPAPVSAGAAGTAQYTSIVDTSGYESIAFAALLGASGSGFAGAAIQVQYGNASNGSDMANVPVPAVPETYNLAPTSAVQVPAGGASLGYLSVELHRPTRRYARLAITPAGGTLSINGAVVLMSRAAIAPPAQGVAMGNVTPPVLVSP
jgi:hypothetical protein